MPGRNVPKFITKIWVEVYDQSGSAEERYKLSEQIRFKTSMLRQAHRERGGHGGGRQSPHYLLKQKCFS